MLNATLENFHSVFEYPFVGSKKTSRKPESFRPEPDVPQLIQAAQKATKRSKSDLINAAIRRGMADAVAELNQISEEARAALFVEVEKILALSKREKPDKNEDK